MIVVMQCAAGKREDAGYLRTRDGRRVIFVGDPVLAPPTEGFVYARPDDMSDQGGTWRDVLLRYNRTEPTNPLHLLPAVALYKNNAYRALAAKQGNDRVYVLSAGWGLIPATFLTPYYDITFSKAADIWKRRSRTDAYADLCFLPPDTEESVVFVGGKDYLPLFARLTSMLSVRRIVFYNSMLPPHAPGCHLVRFNTSTRTNWHYECVDAFLQSRITFESERSK